MVDMVSRGRRLDLGGEAAPRPRTSEDREHDLREIYEAAYPLLVRTLWFVVHDHELAQEIAQDAFIELHRQWRKVRSYDRPDLWVRRVALRKAQREAARTVRRRRAEQSLHSVDQVPPAELPDPELRDALLRLCGAPVDGCPALHNSEAY